MPIIRKNRVYIKNTNSNEIMTFILINPMLWKQTDYRKHLTLYIKKPQLLITLYVEFAEFTVHVLM